MSLDTRPTEGVFWEHEPVLKATTQRAALEALDAIRLGPNTATALATFLTAGHGLAPVPMRFTGLDLTGLRAKYTGRIGFWEIRVADWPRAETVAHEVAHHWVWMDVLRTRTPGRLAVPRGHGWDFTWRLDELAVDALHWLREQEAEL